jgi:eukaryotic-like serine/threonine-protein kinase
MSTSSTESDLLLGLLALQNGLLNQAQLLAAFQAWSLDKSRTLAAHMEARGDLTSAQRGLLEALAIMHLEAHSGNVDESVAAAVRAGESARLGLFSLGDPRLDSTIGHVSPPHVPTEDGLINRAGSAEPAVASSGGERYRVLRPHAHGGLGTVSVALDTELHREVALKQMHDSYADDPSSRQRFVLEAEITGGLEHPGIVPVYGLGTTSDGRPYYAMRFVHGGSFKDAIDHFHSDPALKNNPTARSLELRSLLRRLTDVCNAVEYAHGRGVLHRDVKPGNVIVGKHGETLLVDWGLAKCTGHSDPAAGERTLVPAAASGSSCTLPGSALGTPAYMSPEQAHGDIDSLGPRSDVYSLGATLYCLLTGKAPFAGEVVNVLRAVKTGDFRPPREIEPAVDRALEAVCVKAMATKPEGRYPTPKALADDVERWMADEPVTAWRESRTRRFFRWVRLHRLAASVAAACLGTALAAGWLTSLAVQRERARADRGRQVLADYENASEALVNLLELVANPEPPAPIVLTPLSPDASLALVATPVGPGVEASRLKSLRDRFQKIKGSLDSRGQHNLATTIQSIITRYDDQFGNAFDLGGLNSTPNLIGN